MTKRERIKRGGYDCDREAKRLLHEHFGVEPEPEPFNYLSPAKKEPKVPKVLVRKVKELNIPLHVSETKPKKPYIPLPLKEKTPTIDELKAGIWQYLLDHSSFTPDGNLKVFFIIRSKQNFWDRCNARVFGVYKRYNVDKIEKRLTTGKVSAKELNKDKEIFKTRDMATRSTSIDIYGTWREKLALWLYRGLKNYLFHK